MYTIPENIAWINHIGKLPLIVEEGIKILGIQEIPGPKSNPVILGFAKTLGVESIYTNDDQAWCALSQCYICYKAGHPILYKDKYDYLRALSFLKVGKEISSDTWIEVPLTDAVFGDTLIFKRPGGGHVAVYIGESKTHYIVMGGNQNNMYSFTRVAKERLVGVRRPDYNSTPDNAKKFFVNNEGILATTNEK